MSLRILPSSEPPQHGGVLLHPGRAAAVTSMLGRADDISSIVKGFHSRHAFVREFGLLAVGQRGLDMLLPAARCMQAHEGDLVVEILRERPGLGTCLKI